MILLTRERLGRNVYLAIMAFKEGIAYVSA